MIDFPTFAALSGLLAKYVTMIDENRLEEWLELFVEDCRYEILPRENADLGLPIDIILCTNKNMLRDRVVALRQANEYNLHYDRHLTSDLRLAPAKSGLWSLTANFAVYQTNLEGQSRLFAVGTYRDLIRIDGSGPRFVEKIAIIDSFSVPTLLAIPL